MYLDSNVIEGFVNSILASKFDGAVKTPDFHREGWKLFTGKDKMVAMAAPRGFAKTTAMTVSYGMSTLLFRERKFMILVSDTESQAAMFLGYIKEQLQENQALIELFGLKRDDKGIVRFIKDTETDVVVEFEDGYKFRIIAKGAEQKLRGLIWNGTRPDIILCHEKDTDIYTPETGWIKNQDYPGAKQLQAPEVFKITFDDGHEEVVTGDHRFLTQSGWKYIWELSPGMTIQEDMKVLPNITIKQKLKTVLLNGMLKIKIELLLLAYVGMRKIKKKPLLKLNNMLKKILSGKQLTALNAGVESSEPFLVGLRKMI
jgi:hypothetical protein